MLNNISKGGMIGAIVGGLASTKIHKKEDSTQKKVIKTGLLSVAGYFLGAFVEKKITKK